MSVRMRVYVCMCIMRTRPCRRVHEVFPREWRVLSKTRIFERLFREKKALDALACGRCMRWNLVFLRFSWAYCMRVHDRVLPANGVG